LTKNLIKVYLVFVNHAEFIDLAIREEKNQVMYGVMCQRDECRIEGLFPLNLSEELGFSKNDGAPPLLNEKRLGSYSGIVK
jgi:hypothetical protein